MRSIACFLFRCTLGLAFLLSLAIIQTSNAQDYLDVEEGFETLNLAIESDSLPDGSRNPDRVYRLKNGGFYMVNGTIVNSANGGFEMHIEAADPGGIPPIIVPWLAEGASSGTSPQISFVEDGSLKGLYVSGLDQTGLHVRNSVRLDQDSISVTIDSCFFDYDRQAPLRMNAQEQKMYVSNTIIRNCSRMGTQSSGRCIDLRENLIHTLEVQNCTFFWATAEMINDQGEAKIRNLLFDHNTIVGTDKMDSHIIVEGDITNNLFVNVGWEMRNVAWTEEEIAEGDTLTRSRFPLDSLRSPLFAEEDRRIHWNLNNAVYTSEFVTYANSTDTVSLYKLHNSYDQTFIDTNPNIVSENWINEDPGFSEAPDYQILYDWALYQLSEAEEDLTPDIVVDPFPNDADDILNTYGSSDVLYGQTGAEFKFDYPTNKASYTHAEGGFPLGDLNWFPSKKAEWESWLTNIEQDNEFTTVPNKFSLAQNYPNPFNPVTTIDYQIYTPAKVSLIIYNTIGQKVKNLVNGKSQLAGRYTVQWDGRDESGVMVASGVYLYQLNADGHILSKKMLLIK
jgi:hypothetical protein